MLTQGDEFRFPVINKNDYCRGSNGIFKPESLKFKGILINNKSIIFKSSHADLWQLL